MECWSNTKIATVVLAVVVSVAAGTGSVLAGYLFGTGAVVFPVVFASYGITPFWLASMVGATVLLVALIMWVLGFAVIVNYGRLATLSSAAIFPLGLILGASTGLLLGGMAPVSEASVLAWVSEATTVHWALIQGYLKCCGYTLDAQVDAVSVGVNEAQHLVSGSSCNSTSITILTSSFLVNATTQELATIEDQLGEGFFCAPELVELLGTFMLAMGIYCAVMAGLSLLVVLLVQKLAHKVQSRGGLKQDLAYPGGLDEEPIIQFDPREGSPEELKQLQEDEDYL